MQQEKEKKKEKEKEKEVNLTERNIGTDATQEREDLRKKNLAEQEIIFKRVALTPEQVQEEQNYFAAQEQLSELASEGQWKVHFQKTWEAANHRPMTQDEYFSLVANVTHKPTGKRVLGPVIKEVQGSQVEGETGTVEEPEDLDEPAEIAEPERLEDTDQTLSEDELYEELPEMTVGTKRKEQAEEEGKLSERAETVLKRKKGCGCSLCFKSEGREIFVMPCGIHKICEKDICRQKAFLSQALEPWQEQWAENKTFSFHIFYPKYYEPKEFLECLLCLCSGKSHLGLALKLMTVVSRSKSFANWIEYPEGEKYSREKTVRVQYIYTPSTRGKAK